MAQKGHEFVAHFFSGLFRPGALSRDDNAKLADLGSGPVRFCVPSSASWSSRGGNEDRRGDCRLFRPVDQPIGALDGGLVSFFDPAESPPRYSCIEQSLCLIDAVISGNGFVQVRYEVQSVR